LTRKQRGVELQDVMGQIEVRYGIDAETRIERKNILTATDRPGVARRREQLVIPVSPRSLDR
jgi:hypothetical protein